MTHNVVSISGGKDSTATLLVAIAQEVENLQAVFADTGHEHPETYEYVKYLEQATGVPIKWIKADFTEPMKKKAEYIRKKWPEKLGKFLTPIEAHCYSEQAATILEKGPTGIPFLDMCLVAGRFPSPLGKFCTRQLKIEPIFENVFMPLMETGEMILSWQGVRADESFNRRYLPETDEVGGGLFNYRPIIKWSVESVFEAHKYMGIKPNPLYLQGMSRVGCMPCIHARKAEIREIANRFPDEIKRVTEMERLVALVSKGTSEATFFNHGKTGGRTIEQAVIWSRTSRGGKQFDIFQSSNDNVSSCSSEYGLCG